MSPDRLAKGFDSMNERNERTGRVVKLWVGQELGERRERRRGAWRESFDGKQEGSRRGSELGGERVGSESELLEGQGDEGLAVL